MLIAKQVISALTMIETPIGLLARRIVRRDLVSCVFASRVMFPANLMPGIEADSFTDKGSGRLCFNMTLPAEKDPSLETSGKLAIGVVRASVWAFPPGVIIKSDNVVS